MHLQNEPTHGSNRQQLDSSLSQLPPNSRYRTPSMPGPSLTVDPHAERNSGHDQRHVATGPLHLQDKVESV